MKALIKHECFISISDDQVILPGDKKWTINGIPHNFMNRVAAAFKTGAASQLFRIEKWSKGKLFACISNADRLSNDPRAM